MAIPQRRRLPASDRRQQILETARTLFIERGFEQVSMGDIADVVGTSRPTIYSYFPSTQAILGEVLSHSMEHLIVRLQPLLVSPPKKDGDLHPLAEIFMIIVEEKTVVALLNSGGSAEFLQQRRELLSEYVMPFVEPYLPTMHGHYTAPLIITTLTAMAQWAITEAPDDLAALAREVARFIHGGMCFCEELLTMPRLWPPQPLPDSSDPAR